MSPQEKKEQEDRHLQTPSEANRDKHINFTAIENDDRDPADMKEPGALSPEHVDEKEKDRSSDSDRK